MVQGLSVSLGHCLTLSTWLCHALFNPASHCLTLSTWLCKHLSVHSGLLVTVSLGHCLTLIAWLCHAPFSVLVTVSLSVSVQSHSVVVSPSAPAFVTHLSRSPQVSVFKFNAKRSQEINKQLFEDVKVVMVE